MYIYVRAYFFFGVVQYKTSLTLKRKEHFKHSNRKLNLFNANFECQYDVKFLNILITITLHDQEKEKL